MSIALAITLAIVLLCTDIGLACKYSDKLDELFSEETDESYGW